MTDNTGYRRLIAILITLTVALVLLALSVGRYSINPLDVIGAVGDKITGAEGNEAMQNVLFLLRLPRVFAALLVGAALSVAGAAYQSVFRNPLAAPDLLGVSQGASVGAAAAILIGAGLPFLQFSAFIGGLVAVFIATSLPRLFRNTSNLMLVLAGIIVGGLMNSVLGTMKFLAEESTELSAIVFWQMGSLSRVNTSQVLSITIPALVCTAIIIIISWRLNILSLGDQEAKTVGVNVTLMRSITIACASLLVASTVSISGNVYWIGLVIPNFGRLLTGPDNTKLVPVAALLGGCFMLAIDTAARTITTMEIPLSILTGIVCVPLYVLLLYRSQVKLI